MELTRMFQESSSCTTMSVGQLQTDRAYPITFVESIGTRYGPSILMSLRDTSTTIIKVFLPRRYYTSLSDTDIDDINSASVIGSRVPGTVWQNQII
jgi:hypothetical protein